MCLSENGTPPIPKDFHQFAPLAHANFGDTMCRRLGSWDANL